MSVALVFFALFRAITEPSENFAQSLGYMQIFHNKLFVRKHNQISVIYKSYSIQLKAGPDNAVAINVH